MDFKESSIKVILKHRNKIINGMLCLIIFVMGGSIVSNYSSPKEEINKKIEKFKALKDNVKQFEDFIKEEKKLSINFLKGDTSTFKKFVEKQAKKAKINILTLSAKFKDSDFCWDGRMKIEIIASYKQLVKFIKLIEEKSIIVRNFKYVPDNERRGKQGKIKIDLDANIFKK